jgi:hypothetical protein
MDRLRIRLLLPFLLAVLVINITGCETNEPDNASVRPWNSPQGWESSQPIMNQQHP